MAGISDVPFRDAVLALGADGVVSEMVASGDVVAAKPSARARAELGLGSERTVVQLAGREPGALAEAARWCVGQGARVIDINMGCPAKSVTSGRAGAALMREPDLAQRLVAAVAAAVEVPVTVKMRLGWDRAQMTAPALAVRLEAAGAARIAVHGRTRCDFYAGSADWAAIAAVAAAVRVPVIANGDIVDPETARIARARSGAAGVMVGRGARGRPWRVGQVGAALRGEPVAAEPAASVRAEIAGAHYAAMLGFYGRDLGLRVARKHLGWYLDAALVPPPAELRRAVLTTTDPEVAAGLLREVFAAEPVAGNIVRARSAA